MILLQEINVRDNKWLIVGLNVAAFLAVFPFIFFFLWIYSLITGSPEIRFSFNLWDPFLLLFLLALILILHESIHGIFFKLFQPDKTVKFGVIWQSFMFYATSPGSLYPKGQMLVIGLAPFVINSLLLTLLLALGWLTAPFYLFLATFHAAGCVGDFYYAYVLAWKHRQHKIIAEDTENGLKIFQA